MADRSSRADSSSSTWLAIVVVAAIFAVAVWWWWGWDHATQTANSGPTRTNSSTVKSGSRPGTFGNATAGVTGNARGKAESTGTASPNTNGSGRSAADHPIAAPAAGSPTASTNNNATDTTMPTNNAVSFNGNRTGAVDDNHAGPAASQDVGVGLSGARVPPPAPGGQVSARDQNTAAPSAAGPGTSGNLSRP